MTSYKFTQLRNCNYYKTTLQSSPCPVPMPKYCKEARMFEPVDEEKFITETTHAQNIQCVTSFLLFYNRATNFETIELFNFLLQQE